jgi:predicted nucleotidyltransferase
METNLDNEWFVLIKMWAANYDRIESVHVFGSRARGDAKLDSDIDIAIRLSGDEENETDGYWICMKKKWEAELTQLLPYKPDLQHACDDDVIVLPAVKKEGIRVFLRGDDFS